jgi:hypothetical protein
MDAEKTTTDADAPKAQQKRKTRRVDVARWKAQRRLRYGLYQPRSPKTMLHADRMANQFRRELEETMLAKHGEITIGVACQIQTAMLASRYAVFAAAMLRDEWDAMDPESRLAVHREILKGCTERDKVMLSLGVDKPSSPVLNGLAPQLWTDENQ